MDTVVYLRKTDTEEKRIQLLLETHDKFENDKFGTSLYKPLQIFLTERLRRLSNTLQRFKLFGVDGLSQTPFNDNNWRSSHIWLKWRGFKTGLRRPLYSIDKPNSMNLPGPKKLSSLLFGRYKVCLQTPHI